MSIKIDIIFAVIPLFQLSYGQYNYLCDFNSNFTVNTIGNWVADGCSVTQNDNYITTEGAVAWLGGNTNTLSWTDYTIEAVINTPSAYLNWGYSSIIFRAQQITNQPKEGKYYGATLGYGKSTGLFNVGNLLYSLNGNTQIIDQINPSLNGPNENQDYNLRIKVVGNSFDIYVDNVLQFTSTDNTYTYGSIGLRSTYAVTIFKSLYITFPTSSPTTNTPTSIPTTSIPTTYSPTTSIPTTNIPTSSNPTTYQPSTIIPTTNTPTTSVPTTNFP
eukprot:345467_1